MTPAEVRADYRQAMAEVGWMVKLRRNSTPPVEIDVMARIFTPKREPNELVVGGIKQIYQQVIILAEDVEGTAFTLPFVAAGREKIVDGTKVYNIESPDVQTRKLQGVVVAYELTVSG